MCIVHRPPRAGKGPPVAEVVAAKDAPAALVPGCEIEGFDDMGEAPLASELLCRIGKAVLLSRRQIGRHPEVLEKLPLEQVPAPVEPGVPQLGR